MPPPTIVFNYALRIDLDGVDVAAINDWLASVADNFFVVREDPGDNAHCHAFVRSDKKLPAVRKSLQRFLSGDRGNAAYSLKLCAEDYDGYLRYLCKGDSSSELPSVVGRRGLDYTDAWVKDQHAAYWCNNAAIVAARQKRKKISASTMVEKLEERCKEADIPWSRNRDIAKEYIRMCKEQKKAINIHAARAIVNAVQVLLCPDDSAAEDLAIAIAPDYALHNVV